MYKSFFWCGRWDLNPYGLPYAPQTYASACSATTANIHFRSGLLLLSAASAIITLYSSAVNTEFRRKSNILFIPVPAALQSRQASLLLLKRLDCRHP